MPRVTITVPDKAPQPYRFPLERNTITLGRGSRNDIVIECPSISVNHAELHRRENGYEIKDLNSTNGIKLAGERHELIPLPHGSQIKLGDVDLTFELADEELQALGMEKPAKVLPPLPDLPPARPASNDDEVSDEDENSESAGSGWRILWLLLVVLLALLAGMAVRHQLDTGHWWFDSLRGQSTTPAAAPAK